MRVPSRYIAAFVGATSVLVCLFWFPDWYWYPGSPAVRIAAATTNFAQDSYTPFVLVRLCRQQAGYTAPLIHNNAELQPHFHEVVLHPGYSMEGHKSFVGANLQRQIVLESPRIKAYFAELDEATLQTVRADVGVDKVLLQAYDPEHSPAIERVPIKRD